MGLKSAAEILTDFRTGDRILEDFQSLWSLK